VVDHVVDISGSREPNHGLEVERNEVSEAKEVLRGKVLASASTASNSGSPGHRSRMDEHTPFCFVLFSPSSNKNSEQTDFLRLTNHICPRNIGFVNLKVAEG
jgi:hypothetical protein